METQQRVTQVEPLVCLLRVNGKLPLNNLVWVARARLGYGVLLGARLQPTPRWKETGYFHLLKKKGLVSLAGFKGNLSLDIFVFLFARLNNMED